MPARRSEGAGSARSSACRWRGPRSGRYRGRRRRDRGMARARGRGGHRGGRGRQRDPRPGLERWHDRGARVRPGRRGARSAGRSWAGRPSSAGTCPRATRPRPRPPRRRPPKRSATSRRSGCGPSASCGPGSCTRRTGPRPGRRTSRCCASVGASSSVRRGGGIGASPTTWSSPSTRAWPSGPGSTRRPACAWPRSKSLADDGRVDGARVLDVGCGSGILAIAAVKLGASDALGVDTDPIAIESTLANARRNRLARRIRARAGSLPSGEPAVRRRARQPHRRRPRAAGRRPARRAAAGRDARGVRDLHRSRGRGPIRVRVRRAGDPRPHPRKATGSRSTATRPG